MLIDGIKIAIVYFRVSLFILFWCDPQYSAENSGQNHLEFVQRLPEKSKRSLARGWRRQLKESSAVLKMIIVDLILLRANC